MCEWPAVRRAVLEAQFWTWWPLLLTRAAAVHGGAFRYRTDGSYNQRVGRYTDLVSLWRNTRPESVGQSVGR